jgi:arylformamidase
VSVPTIFDISPLLSAKLAVWPGDTPFALATREDAGTRLGSLHTTLHAGAHADAPCHVLRAGRGIHALELEPYFGACEVLEVCLPPGARILPEHLPTAIRAPRVLFKTGSNPDPARFSEDFVALSSELIRHLKPQGCVLVGIDTPSVDPFSSSALECHHALFEAGMGNLEGLDLAAVAPGLYTLIALPLRIEDGDGSPVRAVLMKD